MPLVVNDDNHLEFNCDHVYIGLSADGNEPTSYAEMGAQDKESLTIDLEAVSDEEIGGAENQKGYTGTVQTSPLQVKDATTIESTYVGKNCWLKAVDDGGVVIRVKNIKPTMAHKLKGFLTGTSTLVIKGRKHVKTGAAFYAIAAS